MRVRVTDDAKGDLRQLKAFISERDAIAAERVIHQICRTLALLVILPRLCHPGVVHATFQKAVPRLPYIIAYRIDVADDERELIVLRVFNTAQDQYDSRLCSSRSQGQARQWVAHVAQPACGPRVAMAQHREAAAVIRGTEVRDSAHGSTTGATYRRSRPDNPGLLRSWH